ncbi:MAG: Re/Si-specific NAD(P)(+) transhydrogenase subunit alpha [Thermoleophilia bacterium]|nr:Re/Si-specific NAD(P)(+) transhydrogenase subunit alpha [Thermoleophilia bacterium]
MRVGVVRERAEGERRVAIVPDTARRLLTEGTEVLVESGAGTRASFPDREYAEAGAALVSAEELYAATELVVRVRPPAGDDLERLHDGQVLVGVLAPLVNPELAEVLATRGVTSFSLDALPRITRAQPMDALSSQATVAGYKAALLAAVQLPKFFPMLTTAAGTIAPARVLVLGAGVAGLQAIATARRLGAVVSGYDVRPIVKEQVESLGATFLELDVEGVEGVGGYAVALAEDEQERQRELMALHVGESDAVIATALVPGRPAPLLVSESAVSRMRPGSVVVDLAAEMGGNCALTQPGQTVVHEGVTIVGDTNLPSSMPLHASQMYSRNVAAFLALLVRDGELDLDREDEILRETCITRDGRVVKELVRA